MITIRPFQPTDADYRQAVDIFNAVWVGQEETAQEWKEGDEKRPKTLKWGRFFADLDGQSAGYASYEQQLRLNHPGKLRVSVIVRPAFRRRGVGTALWQHLCRQIEQFDPLRLFIGTRENFPEGIRFVEKRGFDESLRHWESRLELAPFRLADWADHARRVAEQGIEIRSVVELASDTDRDRKLYELGWAIEQDIPSPEPAVKRSFEEFQKVWQRSNLVYDAWFVALDRGEYVGLTEFWLNRGGDPALFDTGGTGVIRSHRRRGIATALKLRGIEFAQQRGIRELRTWNASGNKGILELNRRLGFVRRPAHIAYVKEVRPEQPDDRELTLEGE